MVYHENLHEFILAEAFKHEMTEQYVKSIAPENRHLNEFDVSYGKKEP